MSHSQEGLHSSHGDMTVAGAKSKMLRIAFGNQPACVSAGFGDVS